MFPGGFPRMCGSVLQGQGVPNEESSGVRRELRSEAAECAKDRVERVRPSGGQVRAVPPILQRIRP